MNEKLTNYIISHIFDNLGLTMDKKISVKDNRFKLEETIEFVDNLGRDDIAFFYGAEVDIDGAKFRVLTVNLSTSTEGHNYHQDQEFSIVIKLDNCPAYACSLGIDTTTGEPYDGIVCFSLNPNVWLKANIAMQGTFLSGMENLKDIAGSWQKLGKHNDLVEELKSFLVYQSEFQGD